MTVLNFHSDSRSATNIDVFVNEPFDFDVEYANAYVQEIIPGVPLRLVRLETLIALKRSAGRDKDLIDIEALTRISKGLHEKGGD